MNSYSESPNPGRQTGGPIIRYGRGFLSPLPAIRNALAVGFLILLMVPVSAQAQVCGAPPCGGGGGGGSKPISISPTQAMAFGILAPDVALPGVAVIDPATGSKTVAGGVSDFGGVHSAAVFAVTGNKNTVFTITLPGAVNLTSGGNSMTLDTFTSSPAVGLLGNNGRADVTVGATLQVGANQAAGVYSGVFDITVNY